MRGRTSRHNTRDQEAEKLAKIKVNPRDVVLFTRQFATMLRSGIPVTFALDTLSAQPDNKTFAQVLARISKMVGEGHKLSHAMGKFPRIFDNVFQAMISIGEETGQIDETLDRLAAWRERDYDLTRQVKGALSYPLFILGLTAVLTFFLFYSILPNFLKIFEDMKIELPLTTKVMVAITKATQSPGIWLIVTALGVAVHGVLKEQWKTRDGRLRIFRVLHEIPLVGYLVRITAVARFAGGIETLLDSGLGLQKTITLGGESSGNPIIIAAAAEINRRVQDGEAVSEYVMLREDLFPAAFAQYVATGEETSSLSGMMGQAAKLLDEEVNYRVEALGAALEPILMGFVAVIVAFVLLSIFTPLYSHIGNLGT